MRRVTGARFWPVALVSWLMVVGLASMSAQTSAPSSTCETCHSALTTPRLVDPVANYQDDVHRGRGFGCVDCHGGDPTTDEMARAKAPETRFRGAPKGPSQIEMCTRCHSDAAFMRRYVPTLRVDQASEYAASVHGRQLAEGNTGVATCTSCHGVHGIRQVRDAQSPIYPLNVANTCAKCHANPAYMKSFTPPEQAELPTDQLHEYRQSVHYHAMVDGNDISAPTCNDCHGNHGAAPPGISDVTNVCGTCHAVFADRFNQSTHGQIFGCVECHGNHAVQRPTEDMLGASEGAVCTTCHGEGEPALEVATQMRTRLDTLKNRIDNADELISQLGNAGMEISDEVLLIGQARNQLTLARTEIHTGDPASLDPSVEEGLKIIGEVEQQGSGLRAELNYRRIALAVLLGAILLVVVALALKIRELDRRHGVGRYAS